MLGLVLASAKRIAGFPALLPGMYEGPKYQQSGGSGSEAKDGGLVLDRASK